MTTTNHFWPSSTSEVVLLEPKCFEEMPYAVQALKEHKSVILNLTIMDASQTQRAVDFMSGATMILEGHQERVDEYIFLFTPSCVEVKSHFEPTRDFSQPQESESFTSPNDWRYEPRLEQVA